MNVQLSLPEELVALTGVSLVDLSNYVQVFPSNMSRFVDNKRSLPGPVLIEMANMLITLQALPAVEPTFLTDDERKELASLAERSKVKYKILQKQLNKMQLRFEQGRKMLQLLPLLAKLPENNSERRKRWLEEQQYKAEKRIEDNGLLKQKKLTIAIALLQQEIVAYLSDI